MDKASLLGQLGVDSTRFARLAAQTGECPEVVVPACAPMTARELVRHVGSVHRLVTAWVGDGRRPMTWASCPGPGEELLTWSRQGATALLETLDGRSPEEPCATWSAADRTVGFWIRRMAQETAVHRVDLAQALGRPWTVDADLAADGVDEALNLWLGTRLGERVEASGRTTRLLGSGADGGTVVDRRVRPLAEMVEYGDGEGPADAVVSGPVDALWSWVWGRADDEHPVQVEGDEVAALELRALLARAQQ